MDSYILTGPNGSQVNVGSWLLPDPGPDFGAKDLLKAEYVETPLAEGGLLTSESVGVRRFTFPLRLKSCVGVAGTLPGVEAFLASLASPGAVIDLLPDGTATADAVRFDVLDGRYEEEYSIPLGRLGRRAGVLTLEVQPYGYWPTEMILASVASIGLPGRLAITGASVVGDVPAAARLTVQPTSPTSYPLGTWVPDMLAWSIGARASMVPFIPAASLGSAISGALAGNAFAPGSQALNLFPPPAQNAWAQIALATVASALEPAYRGCFRAFAWAQLSPSQPMPYQLSIDAVPALNPGAALASAQAIATLAPIVRGASIAAASPAFHLLDLGEINLPPVASGIQQNLLLRLWANPGGTSIGVATPQIALGGLYLLPKDGDHGILARGLAVPTFVSPSAGRFVADYGAQRAYVGAAPTDLAIQLPLTPAPFYRGALPRITPSITAIDLMVGDRRSDLGMLYRDEVMMDTPAGYWPLDDSVATYAKPIVGPTGAYNAVPSVQQAGAILGYGKGVAFAVASNAMRASGIYLNPQAWSIEAWVKRTAAGNGLICELQASGATYTPVRSIVGFDFTSPNVRLYIYSASGAVQVVSAAVPGGPDATYHHYVGMHDGAAYYIYRDASLIVSAYATSYFPAGTALANFGNNRALNTPLVANFDEVALYGAAFAGGVRIAAHYQAGISPSAGATAPLIRAGADFAAVSLTYRPRFRFLKSF